MRLTFRTKLLAIVGIAAWAFLLLVVSSTLIGRRADEQVVSIRDQYVPKVELEPVHAMLICRWPGSEVRWRPEKKDIRSIEGNKDEGEDGDSCVFIYWTELPMAKGRMYSPTRPSGTP